MSELKPCPFCGGQAETRLDDRWWVHCVNCTCEIGFEGMDENGCYGHFETEAKAIDAWNTRESQPCYADEADHSRCKYSVNRGWVERTCKQNRLFNLVSRGCDGEYYQWHDKEMPRYCPNCGARVVEQ